MILASLKNFVVDYITLLRNLEMLFSFSRDFDLASSGLFFSRFIYIRPRDFFLIEVS